MKIRKVSFIEVKSPSAHIFAKFAIPRTGAILLATILKEAGYETKVFIEEMAELDWNYIRSSDVVCISTTTSTAERSYEIADSLRDKNITTIMGGAHVTFMPDEGLLHCNFVIRGEAESALPSLLKCLESGEKNALSEINNLSWIREDGEFVHNPKADFIECLDEIPLPDFHLIHRLKEVRIYPLSTSRGCPFFCKFCSVIHMFGRLYRFKSVQTVLDELKTVAETIDPKMIFFIDDNFAADKVRTKKLLEKLIREAPPFHWCAQVRTDIAKDPRLVQLMKQAGCEVLHIGFESVNPETLKSLNKKQNLREIIDCISLLKANKIRIHGMFVLGADSDTEETIWSTVDFAIRHGIDTVQFLILTPLPGTPFFEEMIKDQRLLHNNWSKYDGHHAVFRPKKMSPAILEKTTLKAMLKFYSLKFILNHILFRPHGFLYATLAIYARREIRKALKEA